MDGRTHVVGAGLAGLSSAVALAAAGREVTVYEAANHAGGRCRSYHDPVLGRRIDNGNHLLLSGNRAVMAYLTEIRAHRSLDGPASAEIPFVDLADGACWTVRPNSGWLPWWILDGARRVPGSRAIDYLHGLRFLRAKPGQTVAEAVGADSPLYRRFWEPIAVAVLNTAADEAAASLLGPVLRETFGRGEAACRPRIAEQGLSETFVDPAIAYLQGRGADIRFGHRLKALVDNGTRVDGLDFGETVAVDTGESVILAVPPMVAAELVPELSVPDSFRAIVNVHFVVPSVDDMLAIVGVVGGLAQWVFVRDGVASVTISAADAVVDRSAEDLAAEIWPEVCRVLDLGELPMPVYRVVKEKRATFAQTPDQVARRPGSWTELRNLFLAGDWTDTGLPATIEGAVRSGRTAAEHAINVSDA